MKRLLVGAIVCGIFGSILQAQVPQLINYQGRVVVGSTNFEGLGEFKFALVNESGRPYWSNDGSSDSSGSEPLSTVKLTVSKGLYSVLLGDATVSSMTTIPATVFTNPEVYLRVWFDDGTNGSQLLTPDQRIAAVGYAMIAGTVPNGAITSAKIATGAVGPTQLASGAAAANLSAAGQSGVASGGVVLSATENAALISAGYVLLGTTPTGDSWQQRRETTPSSGRSFHTAVWTGSEMIIWGGRQGNLDAELNTGGRYDPVVNAWKTVSTAGAPAARRLHTAVWAGNRMVVWGGNDGHDPLNTGGRYDPALNSWTGISSTGAPLARQSHTAVWTDSEMIVWGGINGPTTLNSGGRYNPTADTWALVSTTGAPAARYGHKAVWTGSVMILWGGDDGNGVVNTGGRYNAAGNSWTAVNTSGAPVARISHTAVWTGSEMIVWGGDDGNNAVNTGGRYNPTGNSWAAVSTTGAPLARLSHTAVWTGSVWTGSEMIVWGGYDGGSTASSYLNEGRRYNPTANSWTPVGTAGAPGGRFSHTAVWTGSEMIICGGGDGVDYFNDTFSYTPGRVLYLYQRP
jgi:N-acetylneuraminic acid mutarotase